MAVRIRLSRGGAKKRPFYRIVATESSSPRDGRFIEQLGIYDPLRDPPEVRIDMPRMDHWLKNGARPSDTVRDLVNKQRRQPAAAAAE